MKNRKMLTCGYFLDNALVLAPSLLGKVLAVRTPEGIRRSLITEVEAYDGEQDAANHASKGRTPRTETMYQEGGCMYVYLVYGMHAMFNIVTGESGYPAALLIRGTQDIQGPGRLTKALGIDGRLNGKRLGRKSGVWIEDIGVKLSASEIEKTPRVGVDYAGEWAHKPYRFVWNTEKSITR